MQVGKYQLIHKLATGGMAEVFLAKAAGPKGFEKLLVLKRILPHLASDPSFVEMFLSEARLAAQLNHPNIVQIFDFGEADGTYFLAMEYIDGANLREVIRRATGLGLTMPIALCARIIAAACEGLAFAHNFWDLTTGQELNIIHRDISPDNILLSRQGAVKVVDFGIAKAAGVSPHTQTGVLKGKLSYMPPEYLRNEVLDGRVDVYSLGVVFYELLTGQRPFTARSEAGMVQAVLYEAPVPAVQWRKDLPQAVQRILAKALAKDRESRYLDCIGLQEDLEEFIASIGRPAGTSQLAQLVAMMMAGVEVPGLVSQTSGGLRTSSRYAQLQSSLPAAFAGAASQAPGALSPVEQGPPVSNAPAKEMTPTAVDRPAKATAQFAQLFDQSPIPLLEPLPEPAPPPAPSPVAPARKAQQPWVALVGVMLLLAGGGYLLLRPPPIVPPPDPPPILPPVVNVVVPPPQSSAGPADAGSSGTLLVESQPPDAGTPPAPPPPKDTPIVIPPKPLPVRLVGPKIAPPPPDEEEEEEEEAAEPGTLILLVEPAGTVLDVFMGAFKVGATPLQPRSLSPGTYDLALKDAQKRVLAERRIVVRAGKESLVRINLQKE